MSAAPPMHADNAAQVDYWNRTAGQRWTDRQEEQDLVLRPVSDLLIAAADAKSGDRVIDIGCGCGDTTIDFAGPGHARGRSPGARHFRANAGARPRARGQRPAGPVRSRRRDRL